MTINNVVGKYLQKGRNWYKRDVSGIAHIVVHHSVTYTEGKTNDQMLKELASIHWNKDWPGLSYHRVITPDGTVHIINNYDDLTWTDSHNTDSYAICLVGYFHPPVNMQPTTAQLKALKECLDELCTEHPEFPADQDDVKGHRDRWSTACPGDTVYPYPTEYRNKLGQVNWSSSPTPPVSPPVVISMDFIYEGRLDISNPIKKDHYAQFLGYSNWNEYQITINEPIRILQKNNEDLIIENKRLNDRISELLNMPPDPVDDVIEEPETGGTSNPTPPVVETQNPIGQLLIWIINLFRSKK